MSEIHFTWKGKGYHINGRAAGRRHIVLPNRTVIRPTWQSDPPGFVLAEEVHHSLEHAPLGEIAEHVGNACLAHAIG